MIAEIVSNLTAFNDTCEALPPYYSYAFTAVGAAFSTLGYYVQADFVRYLTLTSFGNWAPLLYMCAAIAGFVGLAIGAPPRQYMWFFLGPGIYWWLLYTPEESFGTEWRVDWYDAANGSGAPLNQAEVYRRLEVGLRNLPYANDPQRTIEVSSIRAPSQPAVVPKMFAWYDSLISEAVINLVNWTGVGVLKQGNSSSSNIPKLSPQQGSSSPNADDNLERTNRHSIMSSIKWSMLENVTGARLQSGDLRDLLVTFLSSECGDKLSGMVDETALVAAASAKNGNLPCSIFPKGSTPQDNCVENPEGDYHGVTKELASVKIPIPRGVRRLAQKENKGSLACFLDQSCGPSSGECSALKTNYTNSETTEMTCADLLHIIISGFRWEAGHVFYQLIAEAPGGLSEADIMFSMFYGWGVRDSNKETLLEARNTLGAASSASNASLSTFTQNLIFVYMLRNEMAIAPQLTDQRFGGVFSSVAQQSDTAMSTSGARSRAGEIYAYAMLIPYVQGCLLYLFAMAYPLSVLLMLVPGWHKSLFTWMSFWAWVKIWDVGFAVVTSLERSIWAMMGNGSSALPLSPYVSAMSGFGQLNIQNCDLSSMDQCSAMPVTLAEACPPVPYVCSILSSGGPGGGGTVFSPESVGGSLQFFDRGMVLGPAVDFDVYNAYYLYIMVALYTAVPAVTAQLVLGARAGAAGLISGFTDSAKSDAGRAASGAYGAQVSQHAGQMSQVLEQAGKLKDARKSGFAAAAIDNANKQTMEQMRGSAINAASQGLGYGAQANALAKENNLSTFQLGMAGTKAVAQMFGDLGDRQLNPGGLPKDDKGNIHWAPLWRKGGAGLAAIVGGGFAAGGLSEAMEQFKSANTSQAPSSTGGTTSADIAQTGSNNSGNGSTGNGSGSGSATKADPIAAGNGAANAAPALGTPQTYGDKIGDMGTGALAMGAGGVALGLALNAAQAASWNLSAYTRQALADIPSQAGSNAITRGYNKQAIAFTGAQAGLNVEGFKANAQASGYGMHGQRAGSAAQFSMDVAGYEATRNHANAVSGHLAAMGADPSRVSTRGLPSEINGGAMLGFLGGSVQSKANQFNPALTGGYFSQVSRQSASLHGQYGSASVQDSYWGQQNTVAGALLQDYPSAMNDIVPTQGHAPAQPEISVRDPMKK